MPYAKRPWVGILEVGSYAICQCGESEAKPYCDGAHARKGTNKEPMQVATTEAKQVALCQCGNLPHCDGSHAKP